MPAKLTDQHVVLLVDDNPTNLGVLFDSLSDSGFKILVAQDGESAIEQVNYLKPDIILLDVMMPGIDGFETCKRLKQNPDTHDIPVLFMTALTETVDKVKGFSVGAVDYITKPFQTEEVLARIQTHLAIQQLQQQLQLQNQKLQQEIREREQVEQSLRVLLHAVSHDLRNPVTGMLMVLKNLLALEQHPEGIAISRAILERMVESGNRQLNLINSLLEAHALETQGIKLDCKPLCLQDLIAEVVQDLQPLLIKNQATLSSNLADALPLVQGDATQIWRVLENLIGNALKHNPPGLALTVETQVDGSFIRCNIRDNGVGIEPEQANQLFELYRRGANARHTHGLGLGLYLCRQIVRAHGGQIGVDSVPQRGSTFWFTLPLAPTA